MFNFSLKGSDKVIFSASGIASVAWKKFLNSYEFESNRTLPDGSRVRQLKQEARKYFDCKSDAKVLRAPGHKLSITWSGEHGGESSSTGQCLCGWEESCNSQAGVRAEYRNHISKIIARNHLTKTED